MNSGLKAPFFSIVVPSYNRAHLLPHTIDLILKQQYESYEILIVDDGSEDDTERVIQENYSTRYPQVKYFKKINEERGAARNFGFEKASGKYVIFFDSDDQMESDYLKTLYENIINLDPDFISPKFKMVNEHNEDIGLGNRYKNAGWYKQEDFLKGNFVACHVCVKKRLPFYIPFENDRNFAVMEDWIFMLNNLKNYRLYLIDKVCVNMLEHSDRSMANNELVIQRRLHATKHLTENLDLPKQQIRILKGFSYYFCGIHAYLDNQRSTCFSFILKSIKNIGFNKDLILLAIKNILGYQFVQKIK